jgi:hypothetical protein
MHSMAKLDDLSSLVAHFALRQMNGSLSAYGELRKFGVMFCPACSEDTRMHVSLHVRDGVLLDLIGITVRKMNAPTGTTASLDTSPRYRGQSRARQQEAPHRTSSPSFMTYACSICDMRFVALIYMSPVGEELAIFPSSSGGLSTPHTPESVAYFLDEAYRCRCAGAHGASLTMFRAALHQLLTEVGFSGKLVRMIEVLEKQIKSGTPPAWADHLNVEELKVIKELGDGFMHANEAERLAALQASDTLEVQETFKHLIAEIYEKPLEQAEMERVLNATLGKLKS